MKNQDFLNLIGEINDDYISEAAPKEKNKKPVWIKWVAVAACLCLLISIGVPGINNILHYEKPNINNIINNKHDIDNDDHFISFPMLDYNNAYYEIINENIKSTLKKRGIDTNVNEHTAGKHISYLKKEDDNAEYSDYIISSVKTDIELMEYSPINQKAIMVVREKNNYYIALFDSYHTPHNESLTFEKVFELYGIRNEEDIKSISNVQIDDMSKTIGNKLENRKSISEIYNEFLSIKSYSLDEFNKLQFSDIEESNADKYYTAYADNLHNIMIETKQGLRFVINYFPDYKWIEVGATLSYYRVSENLQLLFENTFKL